MYVDLAYIPNHCSGKTADLDFFRRVRASYYVVSGNDPANGEPSRAVLDALLEGKAQWGENLQVSSKGHTGKDSGRSAAKGNSRTAPVHKRAQSFPPAARSFMTARCSFPFICLSFMCSPQACFLPLR